MILDHDIPTVAGEKEAERFEIEPSGIGFMRTVSRFGYLSGCQKASVTLTRTDLGLRA